MVEAQLKKAEFEDAIDEADRLCCLKAKLIEAVRENLFELEFEHDQSSDFLRDALRYLRHEAEDLEEDLEKAKRALRPQEREYEKD